MLGEQRDRAASDAVFCRGGLSAPFLLPLQGNLILKILKALFGDNFHINTVGLIYLQSVRSLFRVSIKSALEDPKLPVFNCPNINWRFTRSASCGHITVSTESYDKLALQICPSSVLVSHNFL